jgi:hypothetical protein
MRPVHGMQKPRQQPLYDPMALGVFPPHQFTLETQRNALKHATSSK